MKLDPFYLIVDRASWLPRLLPQGVKLVQLRAKEMNEAELRREIATAREVCARFGAQLIVNDYWKLAIELGCDFVHLGQEDLAEADVPAMRRAGLKLGISTHDEAELEAALLAGPDYIALGPVYPTILKKMRWAPQGVERVRQWKARIGDLPLVGIGGLNLDRAAGVRQAGADSLAVVTDVLLNDNPEARAREWVLATR
ncbi:thiamine-phosphate diphosphorylase [Ancylobacter aquaticus]|uniref:Thiamine-phosphate synthase n=1 Tax=Ancylobacter aquaticus TaxID=100 RepID=A0A4R1I2T1_ANCAQ|nr:thiamine phosphate synthase [Ancylobacter aquaticus]TCK29088.1 thiamine-phosphate diphosphorylase [Ancylobacter aquaticus]